MHLIVILTDDLAARKRHHELGVGVHQVGLQEGGICEDTGCRSHLV